MRTRDLRITFGRGLSWDWPDWLIASTRDLKGLSDRAAQLGLSDSECESLHEAIYWLQMYGPIVEELNAYRRAEAAIQRARRNLPRGDREAEIRTVLQKLGWGSPVSPCTRDREMLRDFWTLTSDDCPEVANGVVVLPGIEWGDHTDRAVGIEQADYADPRDALEFVRSRYGISSLDAAAAILERARAEVRVAASERHEDGYAGDRALDSLAATCIPSRRQARKWDRERASHESVRRIL